MEKQFLPDLFFDSGKSFTFWPFSTIESLLRFVAIILFNSLTSKPNNFWVTTLATAGATVCKILSAGRIFISCSSTFKVHSVEALILMSKLWFKAACLEVRFRKAVSYKAKEIGERNIFKKLDEFKLSLHTLSETGTGILTSRCPSKWKEIQDNGGEKFRWLPHVSNRFSFAFSKLNTSSNRFLSMALIFSKTKCYFSQYQCLCI